MRTRKPEPEPAPIPVGLMTPEFIEAWNAWLAHRKEIGKTVKTTAQTWNLRRMAKWGVQRAVAALEYSIANGWMGVFEPPEGMGGFRGPDRRTYGQRLDDVQAENINKIMSIPYNPTGGLP